MSNTLTGKVSGRMSSRGWAIALGIGAVVLAAILLVVYLDRYRARVGGENAPTPVLVAKQLIPGGHAGHARREPVHVRTDDASAEGGRGRRDLRSRVPERARSCRRHLPGSAAHRDGLRRERHRVRRLADHGHRSARSRSRSTVSTAVSSQVQAGDSVDVYIGSVGGDGLVKLFRPNVKVLTIPTIPGPARWRQPRPPDRDGEAATWLYAADNSQFIFVLRPVVGAKQTKPSQATAASLLR